MAYRETIKLSLPLRAPRAQRAMFYDIAMLDECPVHIKSDSIGHCHTPDRKASND